MTEDNTPTHKEASQDTIARDLGRIRERIEALDIAESAYAGIDIEDGILHVARIGGERLTFNDESIDGANPKDQVIEWFNTHAEEKNIKYIACAIAGTETINTIGSRLWLEEDIVPYVLERGGDSPRDIAEALAHEAESRFDELNIRDFELLEYHEVPVDELVTKEQYKKHAPSGHYSRLEKLADDFEGKTIRFFSATPRGGGVALMRHATVRLLRLFGIDVHWHVMKEREEVFEVTKTKFHNVLQAVADPGVELTEADKKIYNTWIEENVEMFDPVFEDSDVIVIDDPQPSGMIPHIKEVNPDTPIIYRSHIQLEAELAEREGTPQNTTWEFLWDDIGMADAFVAHPIAEFIPERVSDEKVIEMPPTTEPLDGLNKPLSDRQKEHYLKIFDKILIEHGQTPLDHDRPYIIQIARFDPSKGIPDVLESFRRLRQMLDEDEPAPQLVIVGHGSVDDPDGVPVYNLTMDMRSEEKYADIKDDIKVARVHHTDQLLNALLRGAHVGLQLSHKEGFEIKVTEGLMKGVPMVTYRAGGIPLQIKHREGGYLVDEIGDTETVAEHLHTLVVDTQEYQRMSAAAKEHARDDVLTLPGAIRWMAIAQNILEDGHISKHPKGSIEMFKETLWGVVPDALQEYFPF